MVAALSTTGSTNTNTDAVDLTRTEAQHLRPILIDHLTMYRGTMYRTEPHNPMHTDTVRAERHAGFACLAATGVDGWLSAGIATDMPSSFLHPELHPELHPVLQGEEQAPDG